MAKKRILIVEDEMMIAEVVKTYLLKDRYEIIDIIDSGEKCLEIVEETNPDLVIMDIMLAGEMTGVEAAKIVHEKFGTAILFLTAYADEETLEGAIDSDPYGYLVKPVREKDVRAAVKMAFHMIQKEQNEKQ
ncbi:MAG: response regulator [Candidatus Cloacimonetes bacterium]|nr:response regulator [Candidatus Cloacimonadota bacterium]MCF7815232.1 response regulator [Candidatus Cloacimonadota bacterium]MCF7869393.1 response regulator [Candidatus Cloacimonadota bacterium]MCF7884793.1 response regulator [Candidatus Cloacimonadota bacterium]